PALVVSLGYKPPTSQERICAMSCRFKASALLMSAVLFLLTTACSSPVNRENYGKLTIGMDYGEVVELLGTPDRSESSLTIQSCEWGTPPKTISIKFVADKVVFFSSEGLE
ncbi:MAG: hypothetical protein PVH30_12730, partial [Desulfobacterales bacterium]